jgi:hypothetical protein
MNDPSRLTRLGIDLAGLPDDQLALLDSLTDDELTLLVAIKRKADDALGDVEGHGLEGGGVVW